MANPVARIGDKLDGTCYHPSHKSPIHTGGTVISGSDKTTCEGLPVARLGDKVISNCGHSGTIVTASSTGTDTGIGIAAVGDKTSGYYVATIISGANKTVVEQ